MEPCAHPPHHQVQVHGEFVATVWCGLCGCLQCHLWDGWRRPDGSYRKPEPMVSVPSEPTPSA
jgi:hypothetical protein